MPIRFDRDDTKRQLLATAEGPVTADEVCQFVSAQNAIGAWGWRVLFDSSQVDLSGLPPEGIQQIAEHINRVAQGRRRGPLAVVTDADRAARITQIYVVLCGQVDGLTVGVFDDRESAERWLARIPIEH
jgi:hypothetical protein